jgi:hypothetical protein
MLISFSTYAAWPAHADDSGGRTRNGVSLPEGMLLW